MIIGHKKQWELLKRVAEGVKVPQAILFSGQNSLGKKKVALEFVKLLNCQEKNFSKRPCQTCSSCSLFDKGKHPDLIIVEPFKKEIQISQIRELQKSLSLKPQIASFKSVIIDEAESLRHEAQHCFLKTLEEPKGETLFLLLSQRPEMLLETVRSRCQILKFYKLPEEEIKKCFSKEASSPQFEEIFKIAEGRPGIVFDFLANPQKLKERLQWKEDIIRISSLDYAERFRYARRLSDKPEQISEVLETWLRHFRNVLISFSLSPKPEESLSLRAEDHSLEADYSLEKARDIINIIERTLMLTSSTNINKRLALEVLMIDLDREDSLKKGAFAGNRLTR